jgi:putative ABC transport system substrate-binding protein
MGIVSEPVATGLIQSLAYPGGNVTGITDFGLEIAGKHLELLRAVVPNAKTIGVLDSDNPVHPMQLRSLKEAGASSGLAFVTATVKSPSDITPALASLVQKRVRAVIIRGGATQGANRSRILELAAKSGLPTFGPIRSWPVGGGLISYGPDLADTFKQMAMLVDKILRGAKPADLPVQQPTKFELVINLKTAKALGVAIPKDVLLRADEVIQ